MKKLMLGNMAIARGAYEAGVTVVSSYPGTPRTEITENIANESLDLLKIDDFGLDNTDSKICRNRKSHTR